MGCRASPYCGPLRGSIREARGGHKYVSHASKQELGSGRPPPKRCPRPQVLHFSVHDLSNLHVKSRPVRDSHTAQTAIFAPTMRHGEGKFLVCYPPVDGAMCTEGASACGKRCQLAFHCPETPHTPHTRALSCRLDAVPVRICRFQVNPKCKQPMY